jgi:hypothetical protein
MDGGEKHTEFKGRRLENEGQDIRTQRGQSRPQSSESQENFESEQSKGKPRDMTIDGPKVKESCR